MNRSGFAGNCIPLPIVALRLGIAALALVAVLRLTGRRLAVAPQVLLAFAGMGLLNNAVPFCLIVWGQTQIVSGLAAILNALTPILTVLVAHLLTADERLTGAKAAGVALGLAGVAVMMGWEVLAGLCTALLAQLAVLGAALCYAFDGVFGRRFRSMGIDPVATPAGQVETSANRGLC